MKHDNDVYRQLNRPEVPGDLEKSIHANWQQQLTGRRRNTFINYSVVAASLLVMLVGAFLITTKHAGPDDLISIALNDIRNDEKLQAGISLNLEKLLQQKNIHMPPESMPVQMTKSCNLNGNQTTHIKLAGKKQGNVHLFIKTGDFNAPIHASTQSTALPWRLIKPRTDISVLVVYSKDMNPASVDRLIQTMFYA